MVLKQDARSGNNGRPGPVADRYSTPNALSIDLEEWYHPELIHRHRGGHPGEDRIPTSTQPILDLLTRYDVRATFFVVGEVMRRHPKLIREIAEHGHEIACHGMTHTPLWALTPEAFGGELAAFERVAREVLGPAVRVRGFRAPTFSLDHRTHWAVPILAEQGYSYDASVFPVRSPLYGLQDAPLGIYPVARDNPADVDPTGTMLEFPPATYEWMRVRIPVGGGFYLRVLPLRLVVFLLRRIQVDRPFVIYVHPWETDPETPRVSLPPWPRFVTYTGIASALDKLEHLLQTFRFTTVYEALQAWETSRTGAEATAPGVVSR